MPRKQRDTSQLTESCCTSIHTVSHAVGPGVLQRPRKAARWREPANCMRSPCIISKTSPPCQRSRILKPTSYSGSSSSDTPNHLSLNLVANCGSLSPGLQGHKNSPEKRALENALLQLYLSRANCVQLELHWTWKSTVYT